MIFDIFGWIGMVLVLLAYYLLSSKKIDNGKTYQLLMPSKNDYNFEYWTYEGEKILMNGVWNIDAEDFFDGGTITVER